MSDNDPRSGGEGGSDIGRQPDSWSGCSRAPGGALSRGLRHGARPPPRAGGAGLHRARARAVAPRNPGSDLPALALEQAEDAVANGSGRCSATRRVGDSSPLLVGRAAFEICQASGRWPGVLATCDRLPLAADGALQRAPRRCPPEVPGAMSAAAAGALVGDDIADPPAKPRDALAAAGGTTAAS